jgi:UDP-N-acetylmuramoyl-tripeptide--D-alanyl-D-alanine ligase
MTLSWTLGDVAAATGGRVVGEAASPVRGVTTDSRSVGAGLIFVALRGEHFDGHDFAVDAVDAGAVAAVVQPGLAVTPRVEVDDTSAALRDLGAARRRELVCPVVAVTGSTGKTSTKDMLAATLPGSTASQRSYNNEIGVPLTVLGTPDDAPYLVLEVGSRGRGHIAWLAPAVRPDVAIITNLGVVHLETFGTEDVLADSKWELVEALGANGTAVLPVDEPRLLRSHRGGTMTFGAAPTADVFVSDVEIDEEARTRCVLHTPVGTVDVVLSMAGGHQALNAAAATAASLAVGVPLETVAEGLGAATGSAWRMEIHRGRITVVNDAYNANPDSVLAALRTVAELPGRHIAVLGKMAELGPVEAEEHRRMGAEARRLGYATLVAVGEDPGYAAGAGDIAVAVPDTDAARTLLDDSMRKGDVVLVKASRSVGLEQLALELVEDGDA